ncbi:MAG: oligoendopeptidase F [Treponema sp. CETP13]|nr:MAG: oligoendopeptidase F [Treponema sp. CETP13]
MKQQETIRTRDEVPAKDKWDLTTLYTSDAEWEKALATIIPLSEKVLAYKGKLATSAETMLQALNLIKELTEIFDVAGNYAFLKTAGDQSDSKAQEGMGRFMMAASEAEAKISFFEPEILTIDTKEMEKRLEREDYTEYRIYLKKMLHMKPYTLSEKEERLFALQTESMETPSKSFEQLTNVDFTFDNVTTPEGEKPLTNSTWSLFMQNPDRKIRKEAYTKFYHTYDKHKNTIAALYAGSVNQDVYKARARGYKNALERALYKDNVPENVYENLVNTIHANFSPLHDYYKIMKETLKVPDLRHYDVYTPLVKDIQKHTSFDDAVEIIREALSPLGTEYTDILCKGLKNGWVDKYENKGKRSGAFSCGCSKGYPYILTNYNENNIRDVFTLAHEGGHSMHSWYSAHNNPIMHYNYTIFEAEVASTFNEQLLFQYMLKNASNKDEKIYLINMRVSDILATLYRQTMFAEYELKTHQSVENGKPLTTDSCRAIYGDLLAQYFGPQMHFETTSNLEGLRIPHFYNAFYVYKYATGISASLALAKRVTEGGKTERNDYFNFLKSGGSRYPIESLKIAGVDMSSPEPVQEACKTFSDLVNQLKQGLLT